MALSDESYKKIHIDFLNKLTFGSCSKKIIYKNISQNIYF